MEKYFKNNNGFTVKELIFTIVAIIVAFAIGFVLSYVFTNNSKPYIEKISELETQIQQLQNNANIDDEDIDDEEYDENEQNLTAEDILLLSYDDATNASSYFDYIELEDDDSKLEITNYDEVMKNIFTKNGQKIYEQENEGIITFENGKVYMLANDEHTGEYILDFTFEDVKEQGNTITAKVVRKMSREPIILEEGKEEESLENMESYTLKDEIILKKENNNWLVDKYSWIVPVS